MTFTTTSDVKRNSFSTNYILLVEIFIFLAIWLSTYLGTNDYSNWWLENILVFFSLAWLIFSFKKFTMSDLSYAFLTLFLCLHVYGSKYTYAENPFGYWLIDVFDFQRNHYDRLVHFGFGFLLAYPMREVFQNMFKLSKKLSWILPTEFTLSMSGLYEIIEWAVADIFFSEQGDAYLGTQGDIWDAQKICLWQQLVHF
jgi:putative membrane protein